MPVSMPLDHGNGTTTVTVRATQPLDPAAATTRFLRVRVSLP